MLTISEVRRIYNEMKNSFEDNSQKYLQESFISISEYLSSKFYETSSIFSKFDEEAMVQFCRESVYEIYEENSQIFKKGEECSSYYFILFGDINLYDEELLLNPVSNINLMSGGQSKLMKTISAGSLYGHKIKSNFNYFAYAKNFTNLIKIPKKTFDELLDQTNKRKENFKIQFLKKYFPKFRVYSDDIIKSLKSYFIREQYDRYSRIIVDNEYDEFVYLVIKGTFGITKSVKRIKNLRENMSKFSIEKDKMGYVVLECLSKGEIFGVYSALKHQKNNYTVVVLSDKAEVYKISKSHCLYYFGGSTGIIPESLKGLDTVQQVSIKNKLHFLENLTHTEDLKQFKFISYEKYEKGVVKKIIDESEIENGIKDAWKELENLGSRISEFKMNLLKPSSNINKNSKDIFAKMKSQHAESESKNIKIFYNNNQYKFTIFFSEGPY